MQQNADPNYLFKIMQRDILLIEDALFFVTGQFGCSTTDEALFNEDGERVDADAAHRYLISRSFKRWNEPFHLFCSKCCDTIVGTPRRIPQGRDVFDAVVEHLYPLRNGFEDQVDERVIDSPANLRMVAFADSFNKRRQSLPSLAKLVNRYSAFVANKPEWLEDAERLDGGTAAAAKHTAEARFVEIG